MVLSDRRRDDGRVRALGASARVGRFVNTLLLGTLFVPVVVLIVPLYIEVVHPPLIHHSFAESYWAIWLPAGASAFNVVLMKRFFDNLPQELSRPRASTAPVRHVCSSRSCCPSRSRSSSRLDLRDPRGVRNFLWPFLVLTNSPDRQRCRAAAGHPGANTTRRPPRIDADRRARSILGFLIFQRSFLRGSGFGGALKAELHGSDDDPGVGEHMTGVRITHIGGPTALIEVDGWRLLTDPTFDPPGGKYSFGWGTGSVKLTGPAVAASELGPLDAVLLTHDHHDDNLDPAGRALLPSAGVVVTTVSGARRLGGGARGLEAWGRRGSRHRGGSRSRSPRRRAATGRR